MGRPIGNWQSKIGNVLNSYQTSGSAQRSPCEPRQAGNGATVATAACVAGKSGVWPIRKDEGGRMRDEKGGSSRALIHPSTFILALTRAQNVCCPGVKSRPNHR